MRSDLTPAANHTPEQADVWLRPFYLIEAACPSLWQERTTDFKMAEINSPHDNIDVRINSKIQIYGHVLMVGSIFSGGIGIFFLG